MTEQKPKQEEAYTLSTHIINTFLVNLGIGFVFFAALSFLIMLRLLRTNTFGCLPLFMFLILAVCIIYAFGFLGVNAAKCKNKSFNPGIGCAVLSSFSGSFGFVFPIYFLHTIIFFIMFFIPGYNQMLKAYVPRIWNMSLLLERKYCAVNEFCMWSGAFGHLIGNLIDALILGLGLFITFGIINSITAIFTVSFKGKKPAPPPQS